MDIPFFFSRDSGINEFGGMWGKRKNRKKEREKKREREERKNVLLRPLMYPPTKWVSWHF